uniref:Uncharacterized protein n=1 Tax=Onchocerca volvulus TaxID=6282 RepID=A0A8R1XVR7_ONCVO
MTICSICIELCFNGRPISIYQADIYAIKQSINQMNTNNDLKINQFNTFDRHSHCFLNLKNIEKEIMKKKTTEWKKVKCKKMKKKRKELRKPVIQIMIKEQLIKKCVQKFN